MGVSRKVITDSITEQTRKGNVTIVINTKPNAVKTSLCVFNSMTVVMDKKTSVRKIRTARTKENIIMPLSCFAMPIYMLA